jgi:hypothetical protein
MNERDLLLLEILNEPFVVKGGKSYIKLRVSHLGVESIVKITIKDVCEYYSTYWGISTVRTIGPVTGDWRPIDELASFCRLYFSLVNPKGLPRKLRL